MTQLDFLTAMQRAKSAGVGEPLPDGPYSVVVIEANPTTSSTQKPMIRAKYQVENGPHAGRKVFDQFVFSADNDNALSFFFQHMSYFGLDETFFSQQPSWEQVAATLLGRRVTVVLGVRMWDGAMRNEVKSYKPAGAGLDATTMVPPAMPGYAPPAAAPMAAPAPMAMPVPPQVPQPVPAAPMPQMPVPGGVMPPQPAPIAPPMAPPPVTPPVAPVPPPVPMQQPVAAPPPVPAAIPQAPPQPVAPQVAPMPQTPPQFAVPAVADQPAAAPVAPLAVPMPPQPVAPAGYVPSPEEPV